MMKLGDNYRRKSSNLLPRLPRICINVRLSYGISMEKLRLRSSAPFASCLMVICVV